MNQLLDTSMGLSPLDPTRANDLHVNTVNGPPPGFLPASTSSGIVQHLSGPSSCASADGTRRRCCRAAEATRGTSRREPYAPLSLRPMVSVTIKLAHVLDSLVRVSRRVDKPHSELHPNRLWSGMGRLLPPSSHLHRPFRWSLSPANNGDHPGCPFSASRVLSLGDKTRVTLVAPPKKRYQAMEA